MSLTATGFMLGDPMMRVSSLGVKNMNDADQKLGAV